MWLFAGVTDWQERLLVSDRAHIGETLTFMKLKHFDLQWVFLTNAVHEFYPFSI